MISFERLRAPKPTAITVVWEGEDLHVIYDRAAFTIEVTENIYTMPVRERMRRVLLGWDLLRGGVPWQPPDQDDPGWDATIPALRVTLARAGRDTPLSELEADELAAQPITFDDRARAYQAAWDAILLQLDRTFVRAVDTGVLDDFLGVSWRGAVSANGSAVTGDSARARGGTRS